MTSTEIVGPLPTVAFHGGPERRIVSRDDLPRVAYSVPRNTLDPRYAQCTDHHVACDCREAEQAENLAEHVMEWESLRRAARSALAGHQLEPPHGLTSVEERFYPVCLCTGCVIQRATHTLLHWKDVDYETGRVKPAEGSLAMGWAPGEVPF